MVVVAVAVVAARAKVVRRAGNPVTPGPGPEPGPGLLSAAEVCRPAADDKPLRGFPPPGARCRAWLYCPPAASAAAFSLLLPLPSLSCSMPLSCRFSAGWLRGAP